MSKIWIEPQPTAAGVMVYMTLLLFWAHAMTQICILLLKSDIIKIIITTDFQLATKACFPFLWDFENWWVWIIMPYNIKIRQFENVLESYHYDKDQS